MKAITVAIDGPCGAGKSSVARRVAKALGANYLDTGAMYRAVGLFMTREGVNVQNPALVAARAGDADVTVTYVGGEQRTLLSGEDVTDKLRAPEITRAASLVSVVPEVRARMVARQREIAQRDGVVADGRDIGTNVLPDAPLKIYLDAAIEERAARRQKQYGGEYARVLEEVRERDARDMNRAVDPLRKAEDAVLVDCTHMSEDEVVEAIRRMAEAIA